VIVRRAFSKRHLPILPLLISILLSQGTPAGLTQGISDPTWSSSVLVGIPGKSGLVDGSRDAALLSVPGSLSGFGSNLHFTQLESIRSINLSTGLVSLGQRHNLLGEYCLFRSLVCSFLATGCTSQSPVQEE
jgi:hypothetical protein